MTTNPLPQLRPNARQGRAYWVELKAILKAEGFDILKTLYGWQKQHGGITPEMVGALAIRHQLNIKATFDFLEDTDIIPCGTYERLKTKHRPSAILRAGQAWLAKRDGADETTMQQAMKQAGLWS